LKKLTSLKALDFNFFGSSLSNIGVSPFGACLKHFSLLHTLNLNFNGSISFTSECVKSLSSGFDKLSNLCHLRLNLGAVNDQGLLHLSKAMNNLTKLLSFELRFYQHSSGSFTDQGLIHIGKSLSKMESLNNLSFRFSLSPQITPQGMDEINEAIQKLNSLKYYKLLLTDYEQCDGTVFIQILEALANAKSLQSLDLALLKCDILDDDLIDLPSIFKKLHLLQHLSFSFNSFLFEF